MCRLLANGLRYYMSWPLKPRSSPLCRIRTIPTLRSRTREIEITARAIGQKILAVKAGREREIDAAFSAVARSGAGALLVGAGPFLSSRRSQLIGLAALHAIPASYFESFFVDAGGLMSYGASQTDAYRRAGIYVARILKGEKPADLPVELPTKFELAADHVIE